MTRKEQCVLDWTLGERDCGQVLKPILRQQLIITHLLAIPYKNEIRMMAVLERVWLQSKNVRGGSE